VRGLSAAVLPEMPAAMQVRGAVIAGKTPASGPPHGRFAINRSRISRVMWKLM
jgi:hypothetical protein